MRIIIIKLPNFLVKFMSLFRRKPGNRDTSFTPGTEIEIVEKMISIFL